jgi:hypothetical protein
MNIDAGILATISMIDAGSKAHTQRDRTIFESFVEMGWVTPEFAKFGREFAACGIWKDPLGRFEAIHGRSLTTDSSN